MKKSNQIFDTTDYEMFKFIDGNRPTKVSNAMRQSMKEVGWIKSSPLICNQNHEVLDGQHRLLVAMEMGLKVYYAIERTSGREEDNKIITQLNKNQKMWRLQDWIHHHAENGLRSHQQVRSFQDRHRLGISNSIILCYHSLGDASKHIRDGKEFKLNPKRETCVEFIEECKDLFFHKSSKFVTAVKVLHDKAKEDQIKKLQKKIMLVKQQPSLSAYLSVFENLINKGNGVDPIHF